MSRMFTQIALVQVDCAIAWAKGYLARKLGTLSVLEMIVRRVADSPLVDGVVVVTSENLAAQARGLVPLDVAVHASRGVDPLARAAEAAERFATQGVVCVTADRPLIDPIFIDRLLTTAAAHPEIDYISFCGSDRRPSCQSSVGLFAEWCRTAALTRADRMAQSPADRRHATRFVSGHPQLFHLRLIPVPPELDRDDLRLTVDHEEDWDHLRAILDALGPDGLEWRRIAGLLARQPSMRQRMKVLNRREAEPSLAATAPD